jgi:chemotaxis response regulator CheB
MRIAKINNVARLRWDEGSFRRPDRAGCHAIEQDQASSAVYGLPKAAAELHAATDILPLNRIVPRLVELLEPEVCSHEH